VSDRSAWPIVVGGCHRSGTSLVRRMLDAHPRIHCGPEMPFFRDFHGDYRDDPLRHLRFFSAARSLLGNDEMLDVAGAALVDLHARAAARAGKPRWADKAPENVLYTRDWERLLSGRWLLVHVVRNPLDTLASIAERPFRLTLPGDLDGRIQNWLDYTGAGMEFVARHPERGRTVVYEELTADPERVLGELMEWAGERADPAQLDFNSSPHDTGLEDPKVAATSAVHADSVGRWRSELAPADAAHAWRRTEQAWRRIDPELRHVDPPST
jgi:hypothetical protein